jgi:ABC-2 type transport system ATP-binding protein
MNTEKAIIAEDLTKYYREFLAVDHINFTVEKGEIFGFLGPNGAGKTTTVRMLTGISIPSEGSAQIMGYDIQRQAVQAKNLMGIVPDTSNIFNELTAWQNLMFSGKLYDLPKKRREEKARQLLKMFDLYNRRSEKVQEFSRGMKRKICIAMALINDSTILFLDEPTSGLDVQSVLSIRETIRTLNSEGTTVFVTTHNMEEANQLCDRIGIINNGKLVAIDAPEELKSIAQGLKSVEVAFKQTPRTIQDTLSTIESANRVTKLGDKYRVYTDNPPKVIREVWELSQQNKLEIMTINTLGPSLEDVFVTLTGEKPRGQPGNQRRQGGSRRRQK